MNIITILNALPDTPQWEAGNLVEVEGIPCMIVSLTDDVVAKSDSAFIGLVNLRTGKILFDGLELRRDRSVQETIYSLVRKHEKNAKIKYAGSCRMDINARKPQ